MQKTRPGNTLIMRPVTVNWPLIDGAWRAGILSIRSIADEYYKLTGKSVSPSVIKKHYTELGIAIDLTSIINARAQELVNTETVISEDEIVDVNAQQLKVIILTERLSVVRVRRIVMQLFDDLEDQVMNCEIYENRGEIMQSPDEIDHDKLNDLYGKALSFSEQVNNMKKLSNALKTLIDLEHRLYKQDEITSKGGVEDFLRKVRP